MNKIEYVIAGVGLRNSTGCAVGVAAKRFISAWVGPALRRHECFENDYSHPYFSQVKFTSSSALAGLVFVLKGGKGALV